MFSEIPITVCSSYKSGFVGNGSSAHEEFHTQQKDTIVSAGEKLVKCLSWNTRSPRHPSFYQNASGLSGRFSKHCRVRCTLGCKQPPVSQSSRYWIVSRGLLEPEQIQSKSRMAVLRTKRSPVKRNSTESECDFPCKDIILCNSLYQDL